MIVKEKDIASDPVKKLSIINKKVENETEKLYKIIYDPAGDNSVKCHQGNVANQAGNAENAPLAAGLFQLLVHADRAGLRCTPNRKFHRHGGQTQHDQTNNVQQHKTAAAVLAAHPGEFPHIPAANRAAG